MDINRVELNNEEWRPIYTRSGNTVDSIDLKNLSDQQIEYAPRKNNPGINKTIPMDPGDFESIDTDVEYLYARATAPSTKPVVLLVVIHSFSTKRLKLFGGFD